MHRDTHTKQHVLKHAISKLNQFHYLTVDSKIEVKIKISSDVFKKNKTVYLYISKHPQGPPTMSKTTLAHISSNNVYLYICTFVGTHKIQNCRK